MDNESFLRFFVVINVYLSVVLICVGYYGYRSLDHDLDSVRGYVLGQSKDVYDSSAGIYDNGVIVVWADRLSDADDVIGTCVHEAGHWVMDRKMNPLTRRGWASLYSDLNQSNGSGWVTDYASTNFHELFAEHYEYCLLSDSYREDCPRGYCSDEVRS